MLKNKPVIGVSHIVSDLANVCCMQITPSVDSAMFFFGTNVLHFSEEFYGTVLLIDGIAQVIGALHDCTSDRLSWVNLLRSYPTCALVVGSQPVCAGAIFFCMTAGFNTEQPPQLCNSMCCVLACQDGAEVTPAAGVIACAGVAVYNTFLRSTALKKVFLWTALTLIAVHLMQLVLVTGG